MIKSVSNVLSFNDSNISANNNTIYNLYDDNNSFAKMLDEAQNNEEIYSQSVTNKSIEKEEDYQNSLSSQKNNITDENLQNADSSENIKRESIENLYFQYGKIQKNWSWNYILSKLWEWTHSLLNI